MKVINWIILGLFSFVIIHESIGMRSSSYSLFELFGMLAPPLPFALMLAYLYKPESETRHARAWNINAVMLGLLLIMFFVAGGQYRGGTRDQAIAFLVTLAISFVLPAGILVVNLVYLKRKQPKEKARPEVK
jgi:hypothetical protein